MVPVCLRVDVEPSRCETQRAASRPSRTAGDDRALGRDELTLLAPIDPEVNPAVKTYFVAADGSIAVTEYGRAWELNHRTYPVESLHDVFGVLLMHLQDWYAVRGRPSNPERRTTSRCKRYDGGPSRITKAKTNARGKEEALWDQQHHWLLLDLDQLPNWLGLDPALDPVMARRLAQSIVSTLLPSALADVDHIFRWSASTCVRSLAAGKTPKTLGAHLVVWLDRPLWESDAKTLINRLNGYMQRKLVELGYGSLVLDRKRGDGGPPMPKVDPAAAVWNQPLYIASPRLLDGLRDPFPGDQRQWFSRRFRPTASFSDLDVELAVDEAAAQDEARRQKREAARKTPTAHASVVDITERRRDVGKGWLPPLEPGHLADVLPFAAVAQARPVKYKDATDEQRQGRWTPYYWQCQQKWADGVVGDCIRLIQGCGGLPEGCRSTLLTMLSSLAFKRMALNELNDTSMQATMDALAGQVMTSLDWYEREWVGQRKYVSIVERCRSATAGETIDWHGKEDDRRYGYGKRRVIDELLGAFGADAEEVIVRHGLRSLMTDRVRATWRRRQNGVKTRAEFEASGFTSRVGEMIAMRQDGMTFRVIADRIGCGETTVKRLIGGMVGGRTQGRKERKIVHLGIDYCTGGRRRAAGSDSGNEIITVRGATVDGFVSIKRLSRLSVLDVFNAVKGSDESGNHQVLEFPRRAGKALLDLRASVGKGSKNHCSHNDPTQSQVRATIFQFRPMPNIGRQIEVNPPFVITVTTQDTVNTHQDMVTIERHADTTSTNICSGKAIETPTTQVSPPTRRLFGMLRTVPRSEPRSALRLRRPESLVEHPVEVTSHVVPDVEPAKSYVLPARSEPVPSRPAEVEAWCLEYVARHDDDSMMSWSRKAMDAMTAHGIPWTRASAAVQRLWSWERQPLVVSRPEPVMPVLVSAAVGHDVAIPW